MFLCPKIWLQKGKTRRSREAQDQYFDKSFTPISPQSDVSGLAELQAGGAVYLVRSWASLLSGFYDTFFVPKNLPIQCDICSLAWYSSRAMGSSPWPTPSGTSTSLWARSSTTMQSEDTWSLLRIICEDTTPWIQRLRKRNVSRPLWHGTLIQQ